MCIFEKNKIMSKKIKFDKNNFNRHTESGLELLKKSITEVGAIESIATDKDGEIITGNARKKTFDELGYTPVFVKLNEKEYPVIQTNLTEEQRTKAAILANTVAQENINLDLQKIEEIAVEEQGIQVDELGVKTFGWDSDDLDDFFNEDDEPEPKDQKQKIVLEYSDEDYNKVIEEFNSRKGSKEQIVFELLGLQ